MKAVLRSIKPYWLYLILIGKKTVEIGKTFPKSEDWSKTVFLYCSKDMRSFNLIPPKDRVWMLEYLGKVACKFVCGRIDTIGKRGINNNFDYCYQSLNVFGNDDIEVEITAIQKSCIPKVDLNAYGATSMRLFAWHISNIVIYDKPRELGEFKAFCKSYYDGDRCDDCKYFIDGRGYEFDESDCGCNGAKPIERPPQSWMFVEEIA